MQIAFGFLFIPLIGSTVCTIEPTRYDMTHDSKVWYINQEVCAYNNQLYTKFDPCITTIPLYGDGTHMLEPNLKRQVGGPKWNFSEFDHTGAVMSTDAVMGTVFQGSSNIYHAIINNFFAGVYRTYEVSQLPIDTIVILVHNHTPPSSLESELHRTIFPKGPQLRHLSNSSVPYCWSSMVLTPGTIWNYHGLLPTIPPNAPPLHRSRDPLLADSFYRFAERIKSAIGITSYSTNICMNVRRNVGRATTQTTMDRIVNVWSNIYNPIYLLNFADYPTYREQGLVASQCSVLFGDEGAGFVHSLFMKPGAGTLVIIVQRRHGHDYNWHLPQLQYLNQTAVIYHDTGHDWSMQTVHNIVDRIQQHLINQHS